METQRLQEGGGDHVGSLAKSEEVLLDDGHGREGSESTGNSALIVGRSDEDETGLDEEFAEEFRLGVRLESREKEADDDDDEEEEEEEFAFVCENPDGLIVSAEEAFENGQIRPFYPVFGRNVFRDEDASQTSSPSASSSVLRGFLLEEWMRNPSSSSSSSSDGGDQLEGLAEGTYCMWGQGKPVDKGAACRKSNSTGFSKLWRVKDLVLRSNSDGKDTFVFLNPKKPKDNAMTATKTPVLETKPAPKTNSSKAKASASTSTVATKKEGLQGSRLYPARIDKNRRTSYLPYKVGFFTSINGISRNVHPF